MEINRDPQLQIAKTSKVERQAARPVPLRLGEPVLLQGHDGAQLCGELLWPQGGEPRVVAALSHVAPAREVSMLFAALLGGKLLGEGDRGLRIVGAAFIALGVAGLALG
jgi:hypothetical protein